MPVKSISAAPPDPMQLIQPFREMSISGDQAHNARQMAAALEKMLKKTHTVPNPAG